MRFISTIMAGVLLSGCGGGGDSTPADDQITPMMETDRSGAYSLEVEAYSLNCTTGNVPVGSGSSVIQVTQNGDQLVGFTNAAVPNTPFVGSMDANGEFVIGRTVTTSGVEITTNLSGQFDSTGWFGRVFTLTDECLGQSSFSGTRR